MKTHLPVALRKALLVAIVAVSAFAYNKADAAVVIALPDPAQKTLEQGLADSSADIMSGDDGQIEIIDGTRAGSSNSVTWKNIENDTLDFSSDELNDKVTSVSLLSAFNGEGNTVRTGDASITAEAGVGGSQNTLETAGGDIEVTTVSGSENKLVTSGDGNISVGLVQGDHTSISTESGSISIQNVAVAAGKDYQESLKVTSTNGSVTVGVSEALLHDVKIDVGGTLTLGGDTAGREEVLSLRGYGDDSNLLDGNNEITTHIKADGGITVNQSLLFSPGMDNNEQDDDLAHLTNKGRSVMESAGDIKFLGATTRIVGGNNGTGTLPIDTTVCGSTVSFVNEGGTDISADSVVKSTEGSISIQDGNGEVSISGTLISAEDIHIDGGLVQMLSDTPVPSIENNVIPQGIAALVAQGDVVVDGDDATISWRTYINGAAVTLGNETSDTWVWASTIISTEEEIAIYGADVTVQYSNIDASLGKVYIGGDECTTDINGGTVDGAGDVTVTGTDVTISDAASIDSRNGKVTIAGTNTGITGGNVSSGTGDVAISGSTKSELDNVVVSGANVGVTGGEVLVTGERVTGTGLVQIAGATSTGGKGVDVDGGSVSIGSGTGTTTIASANEISTTIDATGDITVRDAKVELEENSVITSEQGNIEIAATGSDLSVIGGSVTTGQGTIAISGATSTVVDGAELGVADGSDAVVGVRIGQPGVGETTVDGSTIDATGEIKVEGAATGIGNGSELQADAGILINSAGAGITDGSLINDSSVSSSAGDIVINSVKSSRISGESVIEAETGSVTMESSYNAIQDSVVIAGADVTMISEKNVVVSITAAATIEAGGSVTMQGNNLIYRESKSPSGVSIVAEQGDITVAGDNFLGRATLQAGGAVRITTSEEGVATREKNDIEHVEVLAGEGISVISEDSIYGNSIKDSSLTAVNDDIAIESKTSSLVTGSELVARNGDVSVSGGVASVADSSIAATGSVEIEATKGDATVVETEVTASRGDVSISGATGTSVSGAVVSSAGAVAIGQSDAGATIVEDSSIAADGQVSVLGASVELKDSKGINTESSVVVSAGNGDVAMSGESVNAGKDVTVAAVNGDVSIASEVKSVDGSVSVTADGSTNLTGDTVAATEGSVTVSAGTDNTIDSAIAAGSDVTVTAGDGNTINAAVQGGNNVAITATAGSNELQGAVMATSGSVTVSAGTDNTIDSAIAAGSDVTVTAGDSNTINATVQGGGSVSLTATSNVVTDSTVSAGADVSMVAAENVVSAVAADTTVKAAGSVSIQGDNAIYSAGAQTSIVAEQGDITVAGSNDINRAGLQAGGAVLITTGEGDMTTRVENATLTGSSVTIGGDTTSRDVADLAVVTGEDMLVTAGSITLNNVSVVDTGSSSISATEGGNISILNRVDMQNATLTAAGHIVVDAGHVLNAGQGSSLQGRLSGSGDINKSGGDALVLSGDNTAFSGSIYANGAVGGAAGSVVDEENAGSRIEMSGAGVGADSAIVLKNTDLIVNSAEAQIGTLDTTQDSAANNAATGGTLLADGSYTTDDNTRTDFTTVGSVLEVQQGTSGNVLHASGMKLSDATLIKLDAEVGADGQASSDIIKVSGSIDMAAAQTGNSASPATAPVTARVFVNHLRDAASADEGARTTIMEGTVASALNEDVLYEVTRSANGTYQRVLQERNVHLENKGDRVDLVYSKNYRSAAKNAQQTAVAGVLQQLSDNFHHSEGTLAASGDTTARLIDAFDYTRSEAAAVRGLQSVAGSGNVLPRLMQFDSSRHHLADLRRQMALPVCPRTDKGGVNRTKNTWITYTGAQDDLGGDAYMGDYSRSAHGFLLGADRSLTCNLRVGASFGYETASGEADLAKVDGGTLFLDAYAVAVTGQLRHRVSFGLASSSFDSKRGVAVEAGYHSFSGQTKSSADGLTLNFGYELSVEQQLNARSSLARYLSVNLSWHKLDAMKEDGLGNMGLETSYDDEWQADVALGLQYNREFTAVRYEAPASFYATAELHLDLLNDRLSARNRFHGPAADWEVKSMKRDTLYVEFGAGVIVPLSPSWTATAGAAVEVGSEHTSFSGNAGVRYSF